MANNVLNPKPTEEMPVNEPRGRRKIDPSEWPNLLAKRQRGATQAEIAREYGVSQGTVSQILKRARENAAASGSSASARSATLGASANSEAGTESGDARSSGPATPRTTLSMPAGRSSSESEDAAGSDASLGRQSAPASRSEAVGAAASGTHPGATATPSRARSAAPASAAPPATAPRSESGGDTHASTAGGSAGSRRSGNPLADRLRDAAEHAANLVDADVGSGDQLGQAVHEVRRALAAIEIDAAKRTSHAVRSTAPEPEIDDNEQFGRIKFFKPEKGFGFIIPDDGGDDVFLSSKTASAAGLDNLTQGDRVRFVPGPGSKGLEAKSIERDD